MFEEGKIWSVEEKNGERKGGKYVFVEEKEKEENIWKRKNFLGEEKGGKHLETENEENFWRNKIYF